MVSSTNSFITSSADTLTVTMRVQATRQKWEGILRSSRINVYASERLLTHRKLSFHKATRVIDALDTHYRRIMRRLETSFALFSSFRTFLSWCACAVIKENILDSLYHDCYISYNLLKSCASRPLWDGKILLRDVSTLIAASYLRFLAFRVL